MIRRWLGSDTDAIGARRPQWVIAPTTLAETVDVVAETAAKSRSMVVRGLGTRQDQAAPPRTLDAIVDLSGLSGIVEYEPGDLVMRVHAGTPLSVVQEAAAQHGQQLAIDSAGTVGGLIATNTSGPRRLRYGTCRDLLIGVTAVLERRYGGPIRRQGGQKRCRIRPRQVVHRLVRHPGDHCRGGVSIASAARRAGMGDRDRAQSPARHRHCNGRPHVDPFRVRPRSRLATSRRPAHGDRPGRGRRGGRGRQARRAGRGAHERCDRRHGAAGVAGKSPWAVNGTGIKVALPLSRQPAMLESLIGKRYATTVRGSLGAGVLQVGLPGYTPPTAALADLREIVAGDGSATVVRVPEHWEVDRWGAVPGLDLMRRIKDQFDPAGLLAPGRSWAGFRWQRRSTAS